MIIYIVANLTATYPTTQIAPNTNTSEWMFNNAAMPVVSGHSDLYIIHASITEYLFIFRTPLAFGASHC